MKKMLCKAAIVIVAVLGVVSCENELTPLGANFLGDDPANVIKEAEFDVKTYSVPVNPVQTSNFSSMPFGIYEDPIYGTSTYEFVAQLSLAFTNPNVGNNAVLRDVRIEVPYFATPTGVAEDDNLETTYRLDSIYGGGSLRLEVYRNNYFLNNYDSDNLTDRAIYYSDFKNTIESNLGELLYENNAFIPGAAEERIFEVIDGVETDSVIERLSPRFRKSLTDDDASLTRWKEILFNLDPVSGDIINARPELANNSLFQDYFRGIYFKVAGANSNPNMIHLNINQAKIVVTIQSDSDVIDVNDIDEDDDTTDLIANPESEITINFDGNRVGMISNEFSSSVITDIQMSNDPVNGAESLYLKGGSGSLAVVELFGQATNNIDGEAAALSEVIENDWIINDAYIDFYVNQSKVTTPGRSESERVLIYDYGTNRLLSDFVISQNSFDAVNANTNHLGRLERVDVDDESSPGVKYRIRVTQHLSNILAGNIPNNRLALVVSQNVSSLGNSAVLNGPNPNPDLTSIPLSAAISHEGTVLHGNLSTDPDKRPKLKIFYSETNN
jgi:hypothetical protein